jgi:hypothetical protein
MFQTPRLVCINSNIAGQGTQIPPPNEEISQREKKENGQDGLSNPGPGVSKPENWR